MDPENISKLLAETFEKVDISAQFYDYVYAKACSIVDRNMPFEAEIKKVKIEYRVNERILEREEAVSAVVANLFKLCEEVRL